MTRTHSHCCRSILPTHKCAGGWLVALAAMTLSTIFVKEARADELKVHLQVKQVVEGDAKTKGNAPSIEATIIGGPNLPLEKFSISESGTKTPVTLKAVSKREYTQGTDTIAIALVINGQEIWIGNEEVETDAASQYSGVLKNLTSAIDRLKLGEAGPPGSMGVIISYSTGAEIKVPMSPLKEITGGALGGQKDYRGKIGTDMVQGITLGLAELSKASTVRKALIVVGDGNDSNNDAAKSQLADLKKQAQKQNIDLFAVIYKSSISAEGNVITTMIPGAKTVNSIEGIASELSGIIERMKDRYYLVFPGYDKKQKAGLTWDGKEHDLIIKIDQKELEPFTLAMLPVWKPKTAGGGFPWLVLILVVAGLLLMIMIGVKVFSSKPAPAPMPMAMPVMAAPPPEAPKPAGPMKTVMIGAGGDEGGFPIVGWLVPLNGAHAYQTFKLRSGGTKIGTAPPSDIVVNDGFMSTDHCMIQCSPAGFVLVDGGSTNGCYVNDRKVAKAELVDNDMITLGKTSFKFKSIS
ncbi:MAG: FHA domain-containing protein [Deltaproteobacteria bacterium]|nr:FHA domain-containing protein [Deltaproteobacteria bacterium]